MPKMAKSKNKFISVIKYLAGASIVFGILFVRFSDSPYAGFIGIYIFGFILFLCLIVAIYSQVARATERHGSSPATNNNIKQTKQPTGLPLRHGISSGNILFLFVITLISLYFFINYGFIRFTPFGFSVAAFILITIMLTLPSMLFGLTKKTVFFGIMCCLILVIFCFSWYSHQFNNKSEEYKIDQLRIAGQFPTKVYFLNNYSPPKYKLLKLEVGRDEVIASMLVKSDMYVTEDGYYRRYNYSQIVVDQYNINTASFWDRCVKLKHNSKLNAGIAKLESRFEYEVLGVVYENGSCMGIKIRQVNAATDSEVIRTLNEMFNSLKPYDARELPLINRERGSTIF